MPEQRQDQSAVLIEVRGPAHQWNDSIRADKIEYILDIVIGQILTMIPEFELGYQFRAEPPSP